METLIIIAWTLGSVTIGFLLLTVLSSREIVHNVIERFALIFLTVPEMVRNGSAYLITHVRGIMFKTADSVGMNDRHIMQKIVAAVLLSSCTILGLVVTTLNLAATFGGTFDSGNDAIIDFLPVSLETLMSVELVIAMIMFGWLLLDILDVTHTMKFFSPHYLPKALTCVFGTIFAIGVIFSIYILVIGASLRTQALFSNDFDMADLEEMNLGLNNSATFLNKSNNEAISTEQLAAFLGGEEVSNTYMQDMNMLIGGSTALAATAAFFGAVGLLPFSGMLITGLMFVLTIIMFGPFWLLGHVAVVVINVIYNFALSFINIFINMGESIRNFFLSIVNRKQTDTQVSAQRPPTEAVQNNDAEAPTHSDNSHDTGDQSHEKSEAIYEQNNSNWNPLF